MTDWAAMFGDDYTSGGSSSSSSGGDYDWFSAIMGGLESYSNARQSSKEQDERGRWGLRATREQGHQQRLNTAFEMSLADWYKQKEKERRRQGFSNYDQFATRQYETPFKPAPLGVAPTPESFNPNYDPRTGEYLEKPRTGGGLAGMARGGGG
jgi:hypothetical protein